MNKSCIKYSLILFFIVLGQSVLLSQTIPSYNWKILSYDVLGNIYLSDGNQIIKSDINNKVLARYEDSFLGEITNIDVYNGLYILVYHADANSLVILNNELTEIGNPINLNEKNLFDIQCAFFGENDKIWIVDSQNLQLKEIDKNGYVVKQASYIGNYTTASKILKCIYRNNTIYLITNEGELLIFDKFGVFSQKISLGNVSSFTVANRNLIYIQNKNILQLNIKTSTLDTIKNNLSVNVKAVFPIRNKFYIFKSNKLEFLK